MITPGYLSRRLPPELVALTPAQWRKRIWKATRKPVLRGWAMSVIWWEYHHQNNTAWGIFLAESQALYQHGHCIDVAELTKLLIAVGYRTADAIKRTEQKMQAGKGRI